MIEVPRRGEALNVLVAIARFSGFQNDPYLGKCVLCTYFTVFNRIQSVPLFTLELNLVLI